jgi:hypothetical protein
MQTVGRKSELTAFVLTQDRAVLASCCALSLASAGPPRPSPRRRHRLNTPVDVLIGPKGRRNAFLREHTTQPRRGLDNHRGRHKEQDMSLQALSTVAVATFTSEH